jgi:NADH-quinone oxidoreductase subunit N
MWGLIITLVVTSAVGLYYYLRIVVTLYSTEEHATVMYPLPRASAATLAILTVLLIGLGIYPAPLLALIRSAVAAVSPGL